jgi:hypothetical protein
MLGTICPGVEVMKISLRYDCYSVRFHALTAASTKVTVFWDIAPYSLFEVHRRFGGAYFLQHRPNGGGGLKGKSISYSVKHNMVNN